MALALGALPVSFILASVVTAAITGWSRPDPEGIIQGCETDITCAESATFWPVWVVCFCVYAALGILLAYRLTRRARSKHVTEPGAHAVPA